VSEKLTRALARVLLEEMAGWDGKLRLLGWHITGAIEKHTAKPGEPEFCRKCEWWGPKITHTGPDAYGVKGKWTEYPERCNHKEAREGFCPEEGERCVKKQKPEKQCETCKYLRRRRVGYWGCDKEQYWRIVEPEYTGCSMWQPKEEGGDEDGGA